MGDWITVVDGIGNLFGLAAAMVSLIIAARGRNDRR